MSELTPEALAREIKNHAWLERFRLAEGTHSMSDFSAKSIARDIDKLLDLVIKSAAEERLAGWEQAREACLKIARCWDEQRLSGYDIEKAIAALKLEPVAPEPAAGADAPLEHSKDSAGASCTPPG